MNILMGVASASSYGGIFQWEGTQRDVVGKLRLLRSHSALLNMSCWKYIRGKTSIFYMDHYISLLQLTVILVL